MAYYNEQLKIILLGLNVVIPLFVIMIVGYGTKKIGLIKDSTVGAVNRLLFWIFLPVLLFKSIYETDLAEVFSLKIIVYVVIFTTIVFLFGMTLTPRFEKIRNRCGIIIQALIRGNEVYFGFPIVLSLLGAEFLGRMSMIIVFAVISFNAYSVIALEYFRGEKVNVKQLLRNVFTNPMIISTIFASILSLNKVIIPSMIMSGINSLSQVATPLALFLLGASFNFTSIGKYAKEIFWVTFFRLVVIPGIVLFTSLQLAFTSTDTILLVITFGVPTSVSSYSLARELGADYELASQFVVFTSSFAILSIFCWIIVFNIIGLI